MVVWLFAGGGEAEVRGLVPFFQKHFTHCVFKRITPTRKKPRSVMDGGPQAGYGHAYGRTGKALADEIAEKLDEALTFDRNGCDLILVLDDLDCHDVQTRRAMFEDAVRSVPLAQEIPLCIGFAAPELEAWIIADWDGSLAKHPDFRARRDAMRHWLSTQRHVSFDDPESFSQYSHTKDACQEKLSEAIVEASMLDESSPARYSKGEHTPVLLWDITPSTVAGRCPLFRQFYSALDTRCQ